MESTNTRQRKSEKITYHEVVSFRKWVAAQGTKIDAAAALGISRQHLDRVMALGQAGPDVIEKIRSVISK